MEPLNVFIHIPKTAGTAFRAVIEHNVPVEKRAEVYRTGGVSLARAFWEQKAIVSHAEIALGHFEHRVHEFVDRECAYFTILRDPVQRVLSLYKFLKYDYQTHPLHRAFNSGELTFEKWIDRRPRPAVNVMTKMVSGLASEYEAFTPEMLPRAVQNLHAMSAVGIQEDYNASVDVICSTLGWTPVYGQRNRSSMSSDEVIEQDGITPEALEKVAFLNALDIELYNEGRSILDSRKAA